MIKTKLFGRNLSMGLMSLAGFATVGLTLTPPSAEAAPAFARQTGMQCVACHSQAFPAINAFGRAFKASGYTIMGAQPKIEGKDMSLPSTFNASVITKLRYTQSNGNTNEGADAGQIEWPNEAALLLGGRVSENIGFMIEAGFGGPVGGETSFNLNDADTDGNLTAEVEGDSNTFLGSKIHFNVAKVGATQLSIIPFSTDALGVGYGLELLNTGATRAQRPIEDRTAMSASQALGLGAGEATGIAFAATNSKYFVNYTAWTPGFGGENMDVGTSFGSYLRAAYMPRIGSWDTGFGFQYLTGTIKQAAGKDDFGVKQFDELVTDGWVIDAQADGQVGGKSVTVLLSTGSAKAGHINNGNPNDSTATALLLQYGLLPNKANAYIAHRLMDNGAATDNKANKTTVGFMYLPSQNLRLELSHAMESGSAVDARESKLTGTTMLQLFAGF
ncbi:MAG: hypothetical protein IBX48_05105 [Thiomicrospira sp.]|uniref:hypothetical protein n=1 Tax=Thiomicrospira sp. TaxID=935 RepID=UPI0019ECB480|nr:hypothetical protein [Thiomicrospira sp.]MBE0493702.1 hypothetical protein [Thiomicrospira sp.]